MTLQEIILEKIQSQGPIRFVDFMEICLYHPEFGYYFSSRNKIGKDGDFYTSPYLTPVFGAMIGRKMELLWKTLGSPNFTIVEYGAGSGRLCADILAYLKNNEPFYSRLKYCIIEKSPSMRLLAKKHLPENVIWYDSIAEIQELEGCIISNELLDNFAVQQVKMEDELLELFIAGDNGFTEVWKPATAELQKYFQDLDIQLPKGFRTECNLQAIDWLKDIVTHLKRGFVLSIDYGGLSSELYHSSRRNGTLLSYYNHQISDCMEERPGEQDITAHVNFSALMYYGERMNLKTISYTDQGQFLLELGFKQALEQSYLHEKNVLQAARQVALIGHALLFDMGKKYKVLIQEKNN